MKTDKTALEPIRRHKQRIDREDVKAIAALCALRLSEKEACAKLGISYRTWGNWKSKHRNNEEYAIVFDEIRASKLEKHLHNIELASEGKGPHEKRGADWRASLALLKCAAPERYSDHVQTNVDINATFVNPFAGLDIEKSLLKVYGKAAIEEGRQRKLTENCVIVRSIKDDEKPQRALLPPPQPVEGDFTPDND